MLKKIRSKADFKYLKLFLLDYTSAKTVASLVADCSILCASLVKPQPFFVDTQEVNKTMVIVISKAFKVNFFILIWGLIEFIT